jgi:hypothetical protein
MEDAMATQTGSRFLGSPRNDNQKSKSNNKKNDGTDKKAV